MPTQYAMTALLNGSTRVNWVVTGAPDTTGSQSGYNPANLTNIVVDYTTNVSSASTGGSVVSQRNWRTVYEVDLTSLTTQSFSADGTVTIDGKPWTVVNKANATSMGIVNGTGLRIACNTTSTDYDSTTRTAPLITTKVQNLYSAFDVFSQKIRISIITTNNASANFEFSVFGFEDNNTPTNLNFLIGKGVNTTNRFFSKNTLNGSTQQILDSINSTHDTLQVILKSFSSAEMYTALSSNNIFPDQSAYTSRGSYNLSNFNPAIKNNDDINIIIGAFPVNTNGTFVANFKRLKIEVFDENTATSINSIVDGYANLPLAGVAGRLFLPNDSNRPVIYRDNGSSWDGLIGTNTVDLYSNRPSFGVRGQRFICTDSNTEFIWNGSSWAPIISGIIGSQPPLASSFTTVILNTTAPTLSDSSGTLFISQPSGTSGFSLISGGSFSEIYATSQHDMISTAGTSRFPSFGAVLRRASTGSFAYIALTTDTGNQQFNQYFYTDYNGVSGVNFFNIPIANGPVFLAIRRSGGNVLFQYSRNPNASSNAWVTLRTVSESTIFSTNLPDQSGIITQGDTGISNKVWLTSFKYQ